jgi:hypothetical protein
MTKIRNTTADMRDPANQMGLLAESMVTGSPETFIAGQERAGQHELVHSDSLPSDCRDKEAFEALGFTFGDPDPSDPLFMPATLPPGWEKRATDHSMGSVITDPLGRERVSIFYKAAFYDRKAHMYLIGLHWYVAKAVEYDGPAVIFDDQWATREAVLAELKAARQEHIDRAEEFRGYAADTALRDEDNRRRCAKLAADTDAKAALYDPHIAALEA